MSWNQIWTYLNSNLAILLLGSGIGFIFLKFVWEPIKARQADREKRTKIQDEVAFRIYNMSLHIDSPQRISEVNGGEGASFIDPTYRGWNLYGLIYAGWNREIFIECNYPIKILSEPAESNAEKKSLRDSLMSLEKKLMKAGYLR